MKATPQLHFRGENTIANPSKLEMPQKHPLGIEKVFNLVPESNPWEVQQLLLGSNCSISYLIFIQAFNLLVSWVSFCSKLKQNESRRKMKYHLKGLTTLAWKVSLMFYHRSKS